MVLAQLSARQANRQTRGTSMYAAQWILVNKDKYPHMMGSNPTLVSLESNATSIPPCFSSVISTSCSFLLYPPDSLNCLPHPIPPRIPSSMLLPLY